MPLPPDAMMSTGPRQPMGMLEHLKALMPFLSGQGQNVELPNESGMVDPRLPKDPERERKAFAEANAAALQGLRGAGR